jgi:CTP synthase
LGSVGEQKTKPAQHSVRELRALGLNPDMVVCRSGEPLSEATKQKISDFCHVHPDHVIGVHDVSNIYRVPLLLLQQKLCDNILKTLKLTAPMPEPNLSAWSTIADTADRLSTSDSPIRIAIVGKYTGLSDSYLSVVKALQHASYYVDRKLEIDWIEASSLEPSYREEDPAKYDEAWKSLKSVHGILVPGGFGDRGVEGKILAANYARLNKIPYLGICLGMQIAVIEYARNKLGWTKANSEEFDKEAKVPVVVYMPEISRVYLGGTMRLGSRTTILKTKDCLAAKLYSGVYELDLDGIDERHRHRYEVNPKLVGDLEKAGLIFVGQDETGQRQEVIELPRSEHPFYFGVQYHPEFKGRPLKPSPPFVGLLLAASGQLGVWLDSMAGKNFPAPEVVNTRANLTASGASPSKSTEPTRQLIN